MKNILLIIRGIGIAKPKIRPKFVPLIEEVSPETAADPETTVKPSLELREAINELNWFAKSVALCPESVLAED